MGAGILGAFEELVLLEVVRQRGEGYGVSLRRELSERTGSDVSMGAVHATLERLEEKGLVRSRVDRPAQPRRGRPRRSFTVTDAGIGALEHTRAVRARAWDGLAALDEVSPRDA